MNGAGPRVGVAADGFFWVKIFVFQLKPSRFEHVFLFFFYHFGLSLFYLLNFVTFFSPCFEVCYESVGGHEQLNHVPSHGLV